MYKCYGKLMLFTLVTFPIARAKKCIYHKNSPQKAGSEVEKLNSKVEANLNLTSQLTKKPLKRCCPYDFDGKMCKVIGDRVLCGFNKNMGIANTHGRGTNLGNGCRLKGNRIECGYVEGPFINSRRPPIWHLVSKDYLHSSGEIKKSVLDTYEPGKMIIGFTKEPNHGTTRCVHTYKAINCL